MNIIFLSVVEEKDQQNVLERAEELSITVEHKVPAMEVECWELERGLLLLTSEHLTITGSSAAENLSIVNMPVFSRRRFFYPISKYRTIYIFRDKFLNFDKSFFKIIFANVFLFKIRQYQLISKMD